jgi:hypothetical protein
MKLKNRRITGLVISLLLLSALLLTSCAKDEQLEYVNGNIDVMGIKLAMTEDKVSGLVKETGVSQPCIYGYEVSYENAKLFVGFVNGKKTSRKVMTENGSTSIMGVKPGMTVDEAYASLSGTKFTKNSDSKYNFTDGKYMFKIISTDGKNVKGVSVETIED